MTAQLKMKKETIGIYTENDRGNFIVKSEMEFMSDNEDKGSFDWVDRISSSDEEMAEGVKGAYEGNMNQYQMLSKEEGVLIQKLESSDELRQTLISLKHIAERKLFELNSVLDSVQEEMGSCEEVISVTVDSEPIAILNKYLSDVVISVNRELLSNYGELFIRAHLALTPSNTILKMTANGLQPILQGRMVVPVRNGLAKFDRLKVMEVSSKYQFQNFTLIFQLESRKNSVSSVIGVPVMSSAFQVLSRNKRKIEHVESPKEPKKKKTSREDSTFVDITALLVLPQKEAAAKLGISESMLCKRFKESTRRKWPYRYLRKIEKTIKKFEENEVDLIPEEILKLQQLREERSSCLQPIKIRVTGRESVQQFPLKNLYSVSTFNSPMSLPSFTYDAESDDEELDSMAQVLQHLKSASY